MGELSRDVESERTVRGWEDPTGGLSPPSEVRLGRDIRFLLVAVGGGAIRVARQVARQRIRFLETVAINCDRKVQDATEFDRRICLSSLAEGWEDAGGSPTTGQSLALAATPVLEGIFDGASFVTLVVSLGGGSGTGVLPVLLDAACRRAVVVSVFVIKPFACEGTRRQLAERAMAGLPFLESFTEMVNEGRAQVSVLDNEVAARTSSTQSLSRLTDEYAAVVARHIRENFLVPTEGALKVRDLVSQVDSPLNSGAVIPAPTILPSGAPSGLPDLVRPALVSAIPGAEAELTFEIESTPMARPP